jgi:hypothetical protein
MWKLSMDADGKLKPNRTQGVLGYQLLLNYCFGHGASSLLLCPYGGPMVNYINHNQTLANVEIIWADPDLGNHMPELLNETISFLKKIPTTNLAFDLVAKRDIYPGEELYLDYGNDWEDAWRLHVSKWEPQEGAEEYVPAWQLNLDHSSRLRTEFEQAAVHQYKYPGNVKLMCDSTVLTSTDWLEHLERGIVEEYLTAHFLSHLECEIVRYSEKDDQFFYTVVMTKRHAVSGTIENYLVEEIPRSSIQFVDRPYTSDMFLTGAFRHDMRIPDAIFPDAWRNIHQGTYRL